MKIEIVPKMVADFIYRERLDKDFGISEVKPYEQFARLLEGKKYRCYGFFDREEMTGYAIAWDDEENKILFLDYFSVFPHFRRKGFGNVQLQALYEKYAKDYKYIITEVENPECAESPADMYEKQGRISRYLKNDFYVCGVYTRVGERNYKIIALPLQQYPEEFRLAEYMAGLYRTLFGEEYYQKYIEVLQK